jgi:hypothetical protein
MRQATVMATARGSETVKATARPLATVKPLVTVRRRATAMDRTPDTAVRMKNLRLRHMPR